MAKFCSECGKPVEPANKFCPQCGHKIETHISKSPASASHELNDPLKPKDRLSRSQSFSTESERSVIRLYEKQDETSRDLRTRRMWGYAIFGILLIVLSVSIVATLQQKRISRRTERTTSTPSNQTQRDAATITDHDLGTKQIPEGESSAASNTEAEVREDAVTIPEPTQFRMTRESVVGDWHFISTNPRIRGQIITDWGSYSFRSDGSVLRNYTPDNLRGTFIFNSDENRVEAKFNRGESGVQVWYFRQTSEGSAQTIYWKNLTLGYEHSEDDRFIKKGSEEWGRRKKTTVNY